MSIAISKKRDRAMMAPGENGARFNARRPAGTTPRTYQHAMHAGVEGQARANPHAPAPLFPLRMRGLPYESTEVDVAFFFYPLPIVPHGIVIKYHPAPAPGVPARAKGEALVAFATDELRELALERNKQRVGGRYVELFPTTDGDFRGALAAQLAPPAVAPRVVVPPHGMMMCGGYAPPMSAPMPYAQPYAQQQAQAQAQAQAHYYAQTQGVPPRAAAAPQPYGACGYARQHAAHAAAYGGAMPAGYGMAAPSPAALYAPQAAVAGYQSAADQAAYAAYAAAATAAAAAATQQQQQQQHYMHGAAAAAAAQPAHMQQQHACAYAPALAQQQAQQQAAYAAAASAYGGVAPTPYDAHMAAAAAGCAPQHAHVAPSAVHAPAAYGGAHAAGALPHAAHAGAAVLGAHGMGHAGPAAAAAAGGPIGLSLRMRGVPFAATELEIAAFFAPIRPSAIAISRNPQGMTIGEATVQFASEDATRAAMGRHRHMLGARYIELFPLAHAGGAPTHADAQQQQQQHVRGMRQPALAAPAMRPPLVAGAAPASASLRMRGLPWGASADDVAAFFLSYGLVREAITFGPMGGQATVWFASPHEAARALAEKNHQHMGQRYIELGYAPPQ